MNDSQRIQTIERLWRFYFEEENLCEFFFEAFCPVMVHLAAATVQRSHCRFSMSKIHVAKQCGTCFLLGRVFLNWNTLCHCQDIEPTSPQLEDKNTKSELSAPEPPVALGLPTSPPENTSLADAATLDQQQSPLAWGGAQLLHWRGQRIPKSMHFEDCVPSTARLRIHAAAEHTARAQQDAFEKLLAFAKDMISSKAWRPVCFVEHSLYDETPLELIVQYQGDNTGDKQLGKCFVVELEWGMVLEELPSPLMTSQPSGLGSSRMFTLRGRFSPCVRAAASADGETIMEVLRSAPSPPTTIADIFPVRIRHAETDEHAANPRAEALLHQQLREGWMHLHTLCYAHKIHTAATRTWNLPSEASTVTGLIHAGKHLTAAGSMKLLKDKISELVGLRLEVLRIAADDGVRAAVLKYFTPPLQQPRRRALVLAVADFFNGAWGKRMRLQHVCAGQGCCLNRDASLATARWLLHRLVSSLLGHVFSRANWAQWHQCLQWFCFADAIHGLITDAFQEAFNNNPAPELQATSIQLELFPDQAVAPGIAQEPMPEQDHIVEDETARLRQEKEKSRNIASHFMIPGVWKQVYLLRVALHAQTELMATLLHSIGRDWEHSQFFNDLHARSREYRLLNLHTGSALRIFFQHLSLLFHSTITWEHWNETEQFRSRLLRVFMRCAACVYQLVETRVRGYPFALLSMLQAGQEQATAAAVQSTSSCMLDRWSRKFLATFPGQQLTGDDAIATLRLLAELGLGTTFSTERLHSKNLNRAKQRQTRKADLHYLSLAHMGFSSPTATLESPPSTRISTGRGPGRPRKDRPEKQKRGGGGAWRAYISLNFQMREVEQSRILLLTDN